MPRSDLWTRDELLVVLDMYTRKGYVPTDPEVPVLAKLTGRTEGSIAMRLANFVHVDPKSVIDGLSGGRSVCEPLFLEFDQKPLHLEQQAAEARRRLQENVNTAHERNVPKPIKLRAAGKAVEDGVVEYATPACISTRTELNQLAGMSHFA
jgi:hypothetical protein